MEDVRDYALELIDPASSESERAIAEKAVADTLAGLCTVMDSVTGVLNGDGHYVRLKFLAQLVRPDEAEDVVEYELDFFDFDGVCGWLSMWLEGDFGDIPTVESDSNGVVRRRP